MPRLLTGALFVALSLSGEFAHAQNTSPGSVTLTPRQWACMKIRLPKILTGEGPNINVPLAPCTAPEWRAVGAANSTTAANPTARNPGPPPTVKSTPIPGNVTRAPLYLTMEQLDCIQQNLPKLVPETLPTQSTLTINLNPCELAS